MSIFGSPCTCHVMFSGSVTGTTDKASTEIKTAIFSFASPSFGDKLNYQFDCGGIIQDGVLKVRRCCWPASFTPTPPLFTQAHNGGTSPESLICRLLFVYFKVKWKISFSFS